MAISHNAIVVQSLAKLAVVGYSSADVSLIIPCIFHSGWHILTVLQCLDISLAIT